MNDSRRRRWTVPGRLLISPMLRMTLAGLWLESFGRSGAVERSTSRFR